MNSQQRFFLTWPVKGLSNLLVPLLPLLYCLRPVAPGFLGQAIGREEQQGRYLHFQDALGFLKAFCQRQG